MIIVACKCGWEGDQELLVEVKGCDGKYCPHCGKWFARWPARAIVMEDMRDATGEFK
jgi:hypothetical protein